MNSDFNSINPINLITIVFKYNLYIKVRLLYYQKVKVE